MSVFDLNEQNSHIDHKIVAGLERLSQVFKSLLWQQATQHQLSPIQIQLLIFIHYHPADKNNISYLANEFNISRPTVSDAIKVLAQKKLVVKNGHVSDGRRYSIALTSEAVALVHQTAHFVAPVTNWVTQARLEEKEVLWKLISNLIYQMNKEGILSVQRTCYACRHFDNGFCNLLGNTVATPAIRIDCPEFQ